MLNVHVLIDRVEHVAPAAAELQRRLPKDQWLLLAALAAEIVARHETVNSGRAVLVVEAGSAKAVDLLKMAAASE